MHVKAVKKHTQLVGRSVKKYIVYFKVFKLWQDGIKDFFVGAYPVGLCTSCLSVVTGRRETHACENSSGVSDAFLIIECFYSSDGGVCGDTGESVLVFGSTKETNVLKVYIPGF